jgi:hypothetical protein
MERERFDCRVECPVRVDLCTLTGQSATIAPPAMIPPPNQMNRMSGFASNVRPTRPSPSPLFNTA